VRATVTGTSGRRVVDAAKKPSRYERGVKRPNPVKTAALQALLAKSPGLSKAELARRLNVSRATIGYYLRSLNEALAVAKERDETLRVRAGAQQMDIAESVATLAEKLREHAVKLLDDRTGDLAAKSVAARLSTAYERLARLSADLSGRTKPAATSVHIEELRAVLLAPLDVSRLSSAAQATLLTSRTVSDADHR